MVLFFWSITWKPSWRNYSLETARENITILFFIINKDIQDFLVLQFSEVK